MMLTLGFLPWQQTSVGAGRVVAFSPVDRQQDINSPIEGRVQRWHVSEGSRVTAGQLIVELCG
jgi:multidrug efflux pump subunit AcrA (membrane-fusion protein)